MSNKFFSTLKGATLLLISVTLISKGFGFIREVLVANYFGAGKEYDIYLVGAVLPLTINNIVFYISQNYFIPRYNSLKAEYRGSEAAFTSGIFWFSVISFSVAAVLLFLFSDSIIKYYLGSEGDIAGYGIAIFRILLISLPLNAGFSILTSYLYSEFRYTYPAFSMLISGILQALVIFLFNKQLGIYVIPAAIMGGYFIQLLYLYFYTTGRVNLRNMDVSFLRNTFAGPFIFFIIFIEAFNHLYVIFDRYYYNFVEEGGIASLSYASIVFQMPISIISFGLATVLFPKISEAFSKKDYTGLRNYYKKSLIYNILIYIPVVIILFFFGEFIVRIVFERGRFSGFNTLQTFRVLQILSISLIFFSSYAIINKIIFSMNLVKQLFYISVISLFIKILLNILLVQKYQQYGLAASSSVTYIFMSISGFLLVQKKLSYYDKK
jgi:putative peptidoglycan lipid II flippase